MPQIEIARASSVEGANSTYLFYVDDVKAANIRDGETKLIDVDEGEHIVQCRLGRLGSPSLKIYVGETGTKLICKPSGKYRSALPERYILLSEGDDKQGAQGVTVPSGRFPRAVLGILAMPLLALAGLATRSALDGHVQIDAGAWITMALGVGIVSLGFYLNRKSRKQRR